MTFKVGDRVICIGENPYYAVKIPILSIHIIGRIYYSSPRTDYDYNGDNTPVQWVYIPNVEASFESKYFKKLLPNDKNQINIETTNKGEK